MPLRWVRLDVLTERMRAQYQIQVALEPAPYQTARWVRSGDESSLKLFLERQRSSLALDRDNEPVFLARDAWELERVVDQWPAITFLEIRER